MEREDMEAMRQREARRGLVRGCLLGGAVGDALGYPVEFDSENELRRTYGEGGIQACEKDERTGKALFSDDTQMTLFTANAILFGQTRGCTRGIGGRPSMYIGTAYSEWYLTQTKRFSEVQAEKAYRMCWLLEVPELYHRRAPGTTCMMAIENIIAGQPVENHSKGCGGVMRVAPMGLIRVWDSMTIEEVDLEAGELAKVTHKHPLGYQSAAALAHIVHRSVFDRRGDSLKDIVLDAAAFVAKLYADEQPYAEQQKALLELAVSLSENDAPDIDNIHRLGEGWVGEEALAIAVYCALRHQNDFSACVIAAVNHKGDSDSTGAIAGNILGAWLGEDAIDEKWLTDLELRDVIVELADDLTNGCRIDEDSTNEDPVWTAKYIYATRDTEHMDRRLR